MKFEYEAETELKISISYRCMRLTPCLLSGLSALSGVVPALRKWDGQEVNGLPDRVYLMFFISFLTWNECRPKESGWTCPTQSTP